MSPRTGTLLARLAAACLAAGLAVPVALAAPAVAAGGPAASVGTLAPGSPSQPSGPAVPPTPPAPVEASAFGMHVHGISQGGPWPTVPVGSIRLWDTGTSWPQLQPAPGRWDWTALDTAVDRAVAAGASVELTLGGTPTWAAPRGARQSPFFPGASRGGPASLADWRTYVGAVAARYRGRIAAYEVWNEANVVDFFDGSPAQLAGLTQAAAGVIRHADPAARVLSASVGMRSPGAGLWLEDYLAAGGSSAVDALAVHLYVPVRHGPESALELMSEVRGVLDRHAVGALPVWDTEIGYGDISAQAPGGPELITGADATGFVARTYLLAAAAGVARTFWYAWDDHRYAGLQLTRPDGSPTPAAAAYLTTTRWLLGARVSGCDRDTAGVWTCRLDYPDGSGALALWQPSRSSTVTAPAGSVGLSTLTGLSRSITGGGRVQLGAEPVLIRLAGSAGAPARPAADAGPSPVAVSETAPSTLPPALVAGVIVAVALAVAGTGALVMRLRARRARAAPPSPLPAPAPRTRRLLAPFRRR